MAETAEIVEVVETVVGLDTRFPVLLTLMRLKRNGAILDRACCQVIGRVLDHDPTEIQKVASWVDELCLSSEGTIIHRCVSISCTGNGAQALWAQIEPEMEALGLSSFVQPVHCLTCCETGPCLALGPKIYLGESEGIHHDDRPWREEPFDQDA